MADGSAYEPVIGLEIHVQLRTRTKMFCGCALSFGEPPNTRTCPVCLGHPGTLPTANEQAIRYGIMIGLALGCEIAASSIFHRKNYFYPDLPKGYQISQYDIPLCSNGELTVPGGPRIRIHRAHLEEDAAKLIHHGESGRIHGAGESVVDFNRGGTPLVEIVTEPDLRSAADARVFLQLLRTTLKRIGVSDVNMEEGSMRCDANVSVRKRGEQGLRTKTELKNMNSFRFIERGIEAEIERQTEIWESGGEVAGETLHFDPSSGSITSLRSKEEVHDYRYFPEPDLVPVAPDQKLIEELRQALPELPIARLERYESEYGVTDEAAETLVNQHELGEFFEATVLADSSVDTRLLAQWTTGELVARLREAKLEDPATSELSPAALAELVVMVQEKAVSQTNAKQVLGELVETGGEPRAIVDALDLGAIGDSGELEAIVDGALKDNQDAVEKIKQGKHQAMGVLVGAVMRETKGRADGAEVNRLIKEKLDV
jgi:aspartyl-tRNA(Asn)/glutamyl-tRNA(Gln) amidotransferase subunit B